MEINCAISIAAEKKKPEDKKERYTESNKKSEHPAASRWDNSTQIRASADHTQAVKEFIG